MDKNLEEQLEAIGEMGKGAYEAGWKAGYQAHKKEVEEAQTKTIELEAKLENAAEELKQGIKDEDGKVLNDEEIDFGERAEKEE